MREGGGMGAIAVMWSHALVPFSELYVTLQLCRTLGGSGTGKKNSPHLLPDEELIPDCVAGEVHSEVRAAGYHLSSPPEDTIVQIRN